MNILSIETSCDETAISVLECTGDTSGATFTVLGDALYSQAHLHAEYGGVFPTLAKREHIKNLPTLLEQVRKAADGVELIAVTQGPGLEPALWTGIEFAKKLGQEWGVPVYGTDHMEGHIVSGMVTGGPDTYALGNIEFPVLGLLISGGHTELVLMKKWFEYELIGKTKDDAVGEAFDKVARMLGLEYPGGPKIEALHKKATERNATHDIVFPRPLIHEDSCDFSFSGLKTAVLYKLKKMEQLTEEDKEHVAQAFQDAARDVIVAKTKKALEETGARTLAVGGGVSASRDIRRGLEELIAAEFSDVHLAYPAGKLHLDNSIMIGMAAYLRHSAGLPGNELKAEGAQRLASR
ncbi:MAG: tRNA (adenosine(37)-N6)-threonylcarbamoyltransferase complex transferase subunit TsaD [Patescibacteria group bacterium]